MPVIGCMADNGHFCFVKKATTGYAGGHKEFHLWIEKENLR